MQDDIDRFENHVFPHIEDVPLTLFTRVHADGVMSKLPPSMKREGMRKGEARRLTWSDVNLRQGIVSLDENKNGPAEVVGFEPVRSANPLRLAEDN